MSPTAVGVGLAFAALGAFSERLASVWPAEEASRRAPGLRTVLMAAAAGLAGWAITARSGLPWWATAIYLALLVPLVLLSATDLEQRRLPHILLDPLILGAVLFVPFNPAVEPISALIGAAIGVGFIGVVGLIIRAGVALGDLYLVAPLGLMLGWEGVFVAIFIAALLSAVTGLALIVTRRAGLKSYIPFGPFLVIGTVITLVRDDRILGGAASLAGDAGVGLLRLFSAG